MTIGLLETDPFPPFGGFFPCVPHGEIMLDTIKRLFGVEKQAEETPQEVIYVEVPRNEPTDTTYYYLNMMLSGLNRDYNYMLMEELKDGTVSYPSSRRSLRACERLLPDGVASKPSCKIHLPRYIRRSCLLSEAFFFVSFI